MQDAPPRSPSPLNSFTGGGAPPPRTSPSAQRPQFSSNSSSRGTRSARSIAQARHHGGVHRSSNSPPCLYTQSMPLYLDPDFSPTANILYPRSSWSRDPPYTPAGPGSTVPAAAAAAAKRVRNHQDAGDTSLSSTPGLAAPASNGVHKLRLGCKNSAVGNGPSLASGHLGQHGVCMYVRHILYSIRVLLCKTCACSICVYVCATHICIQGLCVLCAGSLSATHVVHKNAPYPTYFLQWVHAF